MACDPDFFPQRISFLFYVQLFHSQHLISNSPYCLSYNSFDVSSENLVLDQLISLLFIFFCFICLLDIVFLLQGEIISWSPMGAKGLTIEVTQIVPCSYLMGNINMRRTGNTILRYGNGANPNPHKTPSCKNCRAVYKCIFL